MLYKSKKQKRGGRTNTSKQNRYKSKSTRNQNNNNNSTNEMQTKIIKQTHAPKQSNTYHKQLKQNKI